jgi:acetyl esterase/lipase
MDGMDAAERWDSTSERAHRRGLRHGERAPLHLDIYQPDQRSTQRTAVLMLHGGGWRGGSRQNLEARARLLQAEGFTAMPVEYRLLDEAAWPAPVEDLKAALAWVRANAEELSIAPERVALQGFSAGAQIALVTAGQLAAAEGASGEERTIAAIAAFYPPTLFYAGDERPAGAIPATPLFGSEADPDAVREASPLSYVSANFPPVFFLHGGTDSMVPTSSSIAMYDALRKAGVEADLHIFAGQNHAFDAVDPFRVLTAAEVALFLRRVVSEREEIEQLTIEQSPFARRASEAREVTA